MPKKPRTTATRSRSASRRRSIVAEDLLDLVGVSDPQISPDGTRILFTRSEVDGNRTVRNLWIVETDGRSDAKPLTSGGHDRHGRWSADGGRIAFVRGGDPKAGRPQIAILDLAGGEARIATDLPEGTLRDLQWSPDGRGIAFAFRPLGEERTRAAKERREREGLSDPPRIVEDPWYRLDGDGYFLGDRFRLDWLDLDAGSVRTLFDRDRIGEFAYDVSPDGRTIAITARTTKTAVLDSHRTDLLLIDVATGKARKVEGAPDGPKHAVAFSPDGKHLAIAARTGDDGLYSPRNLGLWAGPVKGRGWRDLLAGTDWCLMAATLSDSRDASFAATLRWAPDGTRILAKIGWHGSGRIASVPIDGSTPRFLTEEGVELSLGNLSHDGRRAALAIGDATTPDEIALGEVSRTAIRVSTLTDFNATFVASRAIAAPIEHWVESTDGVKVQVWELRPPGVSDSSRTPAILEVHGGPHAQYGLTFFHEFQCLAAAGYTVFFSNPRGSKGYGESFCSAIRGSWGEKDWQDVSAVLDFIRSRRNVDAKRIGIMGGSYGGYMTNWAIAHDHSLRAAITDRCVSNMVSMQGNTDHYSRPDRYWDGAPWDRPEALWKSSPSAHFKGVRTPTLIIHSEGDLRCNVEQSEQVHAALVAQGVPTRFVRYPVSTSHGMSRNGPPDLRIHRLREILAWWKRWM
jgi:dipeptidyl aminopeptidase/acylaminoacyl peptidase